MAIGDIKTFNYVFDDNRNNPLNHMEVEITAIDNGDGTSRLVVKVVSGEGDINGIYWHDGAADGNVFALSPFPLHMNNVGQDWDGGVKLSDVTSPHSKAVIKDTFLTAGETYTVDVANVDWNTIQTLGIRATNTNTKGNDVRGVDTSAVVTVQQGPPKISISDASIVEGTEGLIRFTVTMDHPVDQEMRIFFHTANGTAVASAVPPTPGLDDGDYFPLTSGFYAIMPAGATSTPIDIPYWDDNVFENSETFTVTLTSTDYPGAQIVDAVGVGTIIDNDVAPPPPPTITVGDAQAIEGQLIYFPVTLSHAYDQVIRIDFHVEPVGTDDLINPALPDDDSHIHIQPGQTEFLIPLVTKHDEIAEGNELFTLVLESAVAADGTPLQITPTATGQITDNDTNPLITVGSATVTEGGDANFTISLDRPFDEDVVVRWYTQDITATGPGNVDYIYTDNFDFKALTIAAGETSGVISVPTVDDALVEATEQFYLVCHGAPNAAFLGGNVKTGTIIDNDAPIAQAPVAPLDPDFLH